MRNVERKKAVAFARRARGLPHQHREALGANKDVNVWRARRPQSLQLRARPLAEAFARSFDREMIERPSSVTKAIDTARDVGGKRDRVEPDAKITNDERSHIRGARKFKSQPTFAHRKSQERVTIGSRRRRTAFLGTLAAP